MRIVEGPRLFKIITDSIPSDVAPWKYDGPGQYSRNTDNPKYTMMSRMLHDPIDRQIGFSQVHRGMMRSMDDE